MHFNINWDFLLFCGSCIWSSFQNCILYSSVDPLLWCWFLPWDLLHCFPLLNCCPLCNVYCLWYFWLYFTIYLATILISISYYIISYCGCLSVSWAWSFQESALRQESWDTRQLQYTVHINGWHSPWSPPTLSVMHYTQLPAQPRADASHHTTSKTETQTSHQQIECLMSE